MIEFLSKTSKLIDPPVLAKSMFGTASDQRQVNVPASEAWKVYGTLELARLAQETLPQWFQKIVVVEGDGGAGTILDIFFSSGN